MNPDVGDLIHPPLQMVLECREARELAAGQCVVLDIADAAFDLPLGAGAVGFTGPRDQSSVQAVGGKTRAPADLTAGAVMRADQGTGVVAEQFLGQAAEPLEGAFQAFQPIVLALGEKRPAEQPPGEPQGRGEDRDLSGLAADEDDLLAEVQLQLSSRLGLEPHCGQALDLVVATQGLQDPLEAAQRGDQAPCGQFLLDDDRVSTGDGPVELLGQLDQLGAEASRRGPRMRSRLGAAEIASHRVGSELELPRDGFDADPRVGQGPDLEDQFEFHGSESLLQGVQGVHGKLGTIVQS